MTTLAHWATKVKCITRCGSRTHVFKATNLTCMAGSGNNFDRHIRQNKSIGSLCVCRFSKPMQAIVVWWTLSRLVLCRDWFSITIENNWLWLSVDLETFRFLELILDPGEIRCDCSEWGLEWNIVMAEIISYSKACHFPPTTEIPIFQQKSHHVM